ncbi:MAG: translation initiation factor IF-3 [Bacteroidales bacterium]|nr:translation initiation factor IF-3 [Bacteroidales bacterium]MCF8405061.1 translation initiation factor IF-3 [Bacteroidales bacterium]
MRRVKEEPFKVNNRIAAPMVRLVGENIEPGIFSLRDALNMAENLELDLVEISPTANPPVCKIIDYKKFIYDRKKKQKEIKAKTQKVVIKEIRLGPNTDDHDFNFKLKHAEKFLTDGAKVKVDVFFKGRSIVYKDQGKIILLRFAQELEEFAKVEQLPKLEGKRMIMLLSPKK